MATALFAADVGLWYGAHAPTVDRVLALARAHPSGSIRNSARVALGSFRTSDPRLAEAHLVGLGEPDAEHLRNAVVRLYLDLGKYELAFDPDQERDLLAAVQGLVGHPVDAIDWHARGSAELLAAPAAERLEIWRAQRRRDR